MFKLLKKIINWLEAGSQRDKDAYLNKATDIVDLENRMRKLENRQYGAY